MLAKKSCHFLSKDIFGEGTGIRYQVSGVIAHAPCAQVEGVW